MFSLSRCVRLNVGSQTGQRGVHAPAAGGYAGIDSGDSPRFHWAFEATCAGSLDPVSGYLINIKEIDAAVLERVLPLVADWAQSPARDPGIVLAQCFAFLAERLGGALQSLRWRLTPFASLEIAVNAPAVAVIRQRFEFAAAHRLHVPHLSDHENRRLFGKCNLPSGHGHNYVLEPAVEVPLERPTARFDFRDLEEIVARVIIAPFDHKHLNMDTREFGPEGVNPSVENISKVFFDLLRDPINERGGRLKSVTVWETDRTSCCYPG